MSADPAFRSRTARTTSESINRSAQWPVAGNTPSQSIPWPRRVFPLQSRCRGQAPIASRLLHHSFSKQNGPLEFSTLQRAVHAFLRPEATIEGQNEAIFTGASRHPRGKDQRSSATNVIDREWATIRSRLSLSFSFRRPPLLRRSFHMLLGGSLVGLLCSNRLLAFRRCLFYFRLRRGSLGLRIRDGEERERETEGNRQCYRNSFFLVHRCDPLEVVEGHANQGPSSRDRVISSRMGYRHTGGSQRSSFRRGHSTQGSRPARTADRPGRPARSRRAPERDRGRPGTTPRESRCSARRRNASSPARARLERGVGRSRAEPQSAQERTAS